MLDEKTLEILKTAQQANPHYFKAMLKAMDVMASRRKKYSGNFHPYYNFVDVAKRTGSTGWRVLKQYMGMKESRFAVSGDTDYADESVADTLVDKINYSALALGWLVDGLTEDDVIPPDKNVWEDLWPVLCLDLDGFLNQYKGWTGKYEMYEIMPGIKEVLQELRKLNYTLIVCTARPDDGLFVVEDWLKANGLSEYIYEVTNRKPPAVMYLDDRGWNFDGDVSKVLDAVKTFKAYWEK